MSEMIDKIYDKVLSEQKLNCAKYVESHILILHEKWSFKNLWRMRVSFAYSGK